MYQYERLLALCLGIEKLVATIGRAGGWLILPLVGLIVFDAVCRKFLRSLDFVIDSGLYHLMNSSKIQDLEWHLHTVIFFLAIGFAYAHNMHVRLDVFRVRFGPRTRIVIELVGGLILLLPFLVVLNLYAGQFLESAWRLNEGSSVATGLGSRWIIKSVVVIGFALMLLMALSVVARCLIFLSDQSVDAHTAGLALFAEDANPGSAEPDDTACT